MKKTILIISLIFFTLTGFSQYQREVKVKPYVDTTSSAFNDIFHLWKSYMGELNKKNRKAGYKMKEMDESLKSYWSQDETTKYSIPDLYYAFRSSWGSTFYPMGKERFLGIAKRDNNLYELRTMFMAIAHDEFPAMIMTVPVEKTDDKYKLRNKLSLSLSELESKRFENITYYYSPFYSFNDSLASKLNERIANFKKGFEIGQNEPITYFVADDMTEIAQWFGINYYEFDFSQSTNVIEGRAIKNSNMILSAGGGENYLHEIIHILLKDSSRGNYNLFEEGIACYFGEHVGHQYPFHAKRLKTYLKENDWIDLSKGIDGYYKTDQIAHTYQKASDTLEYTRMRYGDGHTNFSYIIHSVLCEMAYRKGGYEKVKEMYVDKADDHEEFYKVVKRQLGIAREDTDQAIRGFLEENY